MTEFSQTKNRVRSMEAYYAGIDVAFNEFWHVRSATEHHPVRLIVEDDPDGAEAMREVARMAFLSGVHYAEDEARKVGS